MVIDNIWIYRKSWIGVLQWAQGMLRSQDYLWHALSLGFGQVIWSRCVTCKWQVNKEMQIIGEVGRKREVEQEGRITAWRSSGLPRREQGGKHASLKGDSKCCYWEGRSSTCASPGMSRVSWCRGSKKWLGSVTNASGNWKNIWEVAGKPRGGDLFCTSFTNSERNSWRQQLTCAEQWQSWMLSALPKPKGRR